jgi:methyltransferase (TIGR00027 family)
MEPILNNITDTALWVAIFRADESERPDAVFHDPFARLLAGERGEKIANAIEFSRKNSWTFVARTFLFDELIRQHIKDGFETIISLAAGLDTRPYHMDLPSTLRWIEVDHAEIIDYKEKILADKKPVCRLESIALDIANRKKRLALFKKIESHSGKTLVICEGLMIYLTEQEAAELADDLSGRPSFRRWAFDLVSPTVLAMSQKEMGTVLKQANITFKFAPEEGESFFEQHGWVHISSHSQMKTAAILKRLPEELLAYAAMPEPEGPIRPFPWAGVCLFENSKAAYFK